MRGDFLWMCRNDPAIRRIVSDKTSAKSRNYKTIFIAIGNATTKNVVKSNLVR
jgi:hypothetical protein